jgi:dihydrofolate reductase
MLTLVVAAADNGVIGIDNRLPWSLPADLARFKALTMGKPIIMGRKTFESLGRVLPGRPHVVITRQSGLVLPERCHRVGSLQEAITLARSLADASGELMVIGGGDVYAQALAVADCVQLTRVHLSPPGDTFFPALGDDWQEAAAEHLPGEPACTFITYKRRLQVA